MALGNVKKIFKKDYNPSLTIASSLQLENTHIANLIVINDIYLYIHLCIFLDFHINILRIIAITKLELLQTVFI